MLAFAAELSMVSRMGRLHGLDGLRGIAALMVLVFHVWGQSRYYLAVDFFFVLSGFVMARTYEGRMPTAPRFLLLRYRRFFPLMAVGATLGLMTVSLEPHLLAAVYLLALLNVPVMFSTLIFPLNSPAWSIFAELVANFFHALLLHRLPAKALLVISALGVALAYYADPTGPFVNYAWFGLPRVLASYPLGIVIFRLNGDTPRLNWWAGLAILLVVPMLLKPFPLWADFAFIAVAPLVVLCGLNSPPKGFGLIGALSFPLYAIHGPLLNISMDALGSKVPGALAAIALTALIVCLPKWLKERASKPTPEQIAIR